MFIYYVNYIFEAENIELFKVLERYTENIKVNIYYVVKDNEKSIVDYKIFLKSTNEEIIVNDEYEMKYIYSNDELDLIEGNTYTVSFEVVEDTFGYEFYIKSVN